MPKTSKKHPRQAATHKARSLKPTQPSWQVQTAKAKFSEVFRRARTEGPQLITRQGKEGVVMIADEQYQQLVGKSHQPKSLVEFFRESPLVGIDLDLERAKDEGRDIEL
jgi:antitoxin Phd